MSILEASDLLKAETTGHVSNRDAAINRLNGKSHCLTKPGGKAAGVLKSIESGEAFDLNTVEHAKNLATAIQGLSSAAPSCAGLKSTLLQCLEIALKSTGTERSALLSMVYRAACRLDEVLHKPTLHAE